MRIRVSRAVRSVKGPSGIHAAVDQRPERERAARNEKIPAQQIQFRKGHVSRADHHRQHKISEYGRNRRDQKEPNHQHAVNGEEFVVSLGGDEVALRREQFQAHHRRRHARDDEENENHEEIKQADAFVIGRQQPGPDAMIDAQIVDRRELAFRLDDCFDGVFHFS